MSASRYEVSKFTKQCRERHTGAQTSLKPIGECEHRNRDDYISLGRRAIELGFPLFIEGPTASGKGEMVREIVGRDVPISHVCGGDEKDLIGSYVIDGSRFTFQNGVLLNALLYGGVIHMSYNGNQKGNGFPGSLVRSVLSGSFYVSSLCKTVTRHKNFVLIVTSTSKREQPRTDFPLLDLFVHLKVSELTLEQINRRAVQESEDMIQYVPILSGVHASLSLDPPTYDGRFYTIKELVLMYNMIERCSADIGLGKGYLCSLGSMFNGTQYGPLSGADENSYKEHTEEILSFFSNPTNIIHKRTEPDKSGQVTVLGNKELDKRFSNLVAFIPPARKQLIAAVVCMCSLSFIGGEGLAGENRRRYAKLVCHVLGLQDSDTDAILERSLSYNYNLGDRTLNIGLAHECYRGDANYSLGIAPCSTTLRYLENLLLATSYSPILLVGETGVGKTLLVSTLHSMLAGSHESLLSVNLSKNTTSEELLGSYKPIAKDQLATQIIDAFQKVLGESSRASLTKNGKFVNSVRQLVLDHHYNEAVGKIKRAVEMMISKIVGDPTRPTDRKKSPIDPNSPKANEEVGKLKQLLNNCELALSNSLFVYQRGILLEAAAQGRWVLLDEANLATDELLFSLLPCVTRTGFPAVPGRGPVAIHPSFRLFLCMNPPTDVGKRHLPDAIRGRMYELYVQDINSFSDINCIVGHINQSFPFGPISSLYLQLKHFTTDYKLDAREQSLVGVGNKVPVFTLRTLTRGLKMANRLLAIAQNNSDSEELKALMTMTQQRALLEALLCVFSNNLSKPSTELVVSLVTSIFKSASKPSQQILRAQDTTQPMKYEEALNTILGILGQRLFNCLFYSERVANSVSRPSNPYNNFDQRGREAPQNPLFLQRQKLNLMQKKKKKNRFSFSHEDMGDVLVDLPPPTYTSTHVYFLGYKIPLGPFGQSSQRQGQRRYTLTRSRINVLVNIIRGLLCNIPVLLEGETSSGKTSILYFLADITGNRIIRINNHSGTDVDEYMGKYFPTNNQDPSLGLFTFVEGPLVTSVRRGHWLLLDELNLAPSEVLESLNRLLDDNNELLIHNSGSASGDVGATVIKPHPSFYLCATQNPCSADYGGRHELSRAFRNRFLELSVESISYKELFLILRDRNITNDKIASRIIKVLATLKSIRVNYDNLLDGGDNTVTVRDIMRIADTRPGIRIDRIDGKLVADKNAKYKELAMNSALFIAEKIREKKIRRDVFGLINETLKTNINEEEIFDGFIGNIESIINNINSEIERDPESYTALSHPLYKFKHITFTSAFRRLIAIILFFVCHNCNLLLVGPTGTGKTTAAQLLYDYINGNSSSTFNGTNSSERNTPSGTSVNIFNGTKNTDTSDFIGGVKVNNSNLDDSQSRSSDQLSCYSLGSYFSTNREDTKFTQMLDSTIEMCFQNAGKIGETTVSTDILMLNDPMARKTKTLIKLALLNNIININTNRPNNSAKFMVQDDYSADETIGECGVLDCPLVFDRIHVLYKCLRGNNSVIATLMKQQKLRLSNIKHFETLFPRHLFDFDIDLNISMFRWVDGCLTAALKESSFIVFDEINLISDNVLERINSVLEDRGGLTVPELNNVVTVDGEVANEAYSFGNNLGFSFISTMNPSGDFGKRELTKAMRNRLVEVYVDGDEGLGSYMDIFKKIARPTDETMNLLERALTILINERHVPISYRDIKGIADFCCAGLSLYKALRVVILDGLEIRTRIYELEENKQKASVGDKSDRGFCDSIRKEMKKMFGLVEPMAFCEGNLVISPSFHEHWDETDEPTDMKIAKQFSIKFDFPNEGDSVIYPIGPLLVQRIMDTVGTFGRARCGQPLQYKDITEMVVTLLKEHIRNCQLSFFPTKTFIPLLYSLLVSLRTNIKPVLLEGAPGIGKTAVVQFVADTIGITLNRVNMSHTTEMGDLMGQETLDFDSVSPTDNGALTGDAGDGDESATKKQQYGVLLSSMINGCWVLIDELNLCSQSVLEGLNPLLDHRRNIVTRSNTRIQLGATSPFRIIGAQNPDASDKGRKSLPASFKNRFVLLYCRKLKESEFETIANHCYITTTANTVDTPNDEVTEAMNIASCDAACDDKVKKRSGASLLVRFMRSINKRLYNTEIQTEQTDKDINEKLRQRLEKATGFVVCDNTSEVTDGKQKKQGKKVPKAPVIFGQQGRPWEYNLRDIIKFIKLKHQWETKISPSMATQVVSDTLDDFLFRNIFVERLRTVYDRQFMEALYESKMLRNRQLLGTGVGSYYNSSLVQIDDEFLGQSLVTNGLYSHSIHNTRRLGQRLQGVEGSCGKTDKHVVTVQNLLLTTDFPVLINYSNGYGMQINEPKKLQMNVSDKVSCPVVLDVSCGYIEEVLDSVVSLFDTNSVVTIQTSKATEINELIGGYEEFDIAKELSLVELEVCNYSLFLLSCSTANVKYLETNRTEFAETIKSIGTKKKHLRSLVFQLAEFSGHEEGGQSTHNTSLGMEFGSRDTEKSLLSQIARDRIIIDAAWDLLSSLLFLKENRFHLYTRRDMLLALTKLEQLLLLSMRIKRGEKVSPIEASVIPLFKFYYSPLVKAVAMGQLVVLRDISNLSSSVIDRLLPILEDIKEIQLHEKTTNFDVSIAPGMAGTAEENIVISKNKQLQQIPVKSQYQFSDIINTSLIDRYNTSSTILPLPSCVVRDGMEIIAKHNNFRIIMTNNFDTGLSSSNVSRPLRNRCFEVTLSKLDTIAATNMLHNSLGDPQLFENIFVRDAAVSVLQFLSINSGLGMGVLMKHLGFLKAFLGRERGRSDTFSAQLLGVGVLETFELVYLAELANTDNNKYKELHSKLVKLVAHLEEIRNLGDVYRVLEAAELQDSKQDTQVMLYDRTWSMFSKVAKSLVGFNIKPLLLLLSGHDGIGSVVGSTITSLSRVLAYVVSLPIFQSTPLSKMYVRLMKANEKELKQLMNVQPEKGKTVIVYQDALRVVLLGESIHNNVREQDVMNYQVLVDMVEIINKQAGSNQENALGSAGNLVECLVRGTVFGSDWKQSLVMSQLERYPVLGIHNGLLFKLLVLSLLSKTVASQEGKFVRLFSFGTKEEDLFNCVVGLAELIRNNNGNVTSVINSDTINLLHIVSLIKEFATSQTGTLNPFTPFQVNSIGYCLKELQKYINSHPATTKEVCIVSTMLARGTFCFGSSGDGLGEMYTQSHSLAASYFLATVSHILQHISMNYCQCPMDVGTGSHSGEASGVTKYQNFINVRRTGRLQKQLVRADLYEPIGCLLSQIIQLLIRIEERDKTLVSSEKGDYDEFIDTSREVTNSFTKLFVFKRKHAAPYTQPVLGFSPVDLVNDRIVKVFHVQQEQKGMANKGITVGQQTSHDNNGVEELDNILLTLQQGNSVVTACKELDWTTTSVLSLSETQPTSLTDLSNTYKRLLLDISTREKLGNSATAEQLNKPHFDLLSEHDLFFGGVRLLKGGGTEEEKEKGRNILMKSIRRNKANKLAPLERLSNLVAYQSSESLISHTATNHSHKHFKDTLFLIYDTLYNLSDETLTKLHLEQDKIQKSGDAPNHNNDRSPLLSAIAHTAPSQFLLPEIRRQLEEFRLPTQDPNEDPSGNILEYQRYLVGGRYEGALQSNYLSLKENGFVASPLQSNVSGLDIAFHLRKLFKLLKAPREVLSKMRREANHLGSNGEQRMDAIRLYLQSLCECFDSVADTIGTKFVSDVTSAINAFTAGIGSNPKVSSHIVELRTASLLWTVFGLTLFQLFDFSSLADPAMESASLCKAVGTVERLLDGVDVELGRTTNVDGLGVSLPLKTIRKEMRQTEKRIIARLNNPGVWSTGSMISELMRFRTAGPIIMGLINSNQNQAASVDNYVLSLSQALATFDTMDITLREEELDETEQLNNLMPGGKPIPQLIYDILTGTSSTNTNSSDPSRTTTGSRRQQQRQSQRRKPTKTTAEFMPFHTAYVDILLPVETAVLCVIHAAAIAHHATKEASCPVEKVKGLLSTALDTTKGHNNCATIANPMHSDIPIVLTAISEAANPDRERRLWLLGEIGRKLQERDDEKTKRLLDGKPLDETTLYRRSHSTRDEAEEQRMKTALLFSFDNLWDTTTQDRMGAADRLSLNPIDKEKQKHIRNMQMADKEMLCVADWLVRGPFMLGQKAGELGVTPLAMAASLTLAIEDVTVANLTHSLAISCGRAQSLLGSEAEQYIGDHILRACNAHAVLGETINPVVLEQLLSMNSRRLTSLALSAATKVRRQGIKQYLGLSWQNKGSQEAKGKKKKGNKGGKDTRRVAYQASLSRLKGTMRYTNLPQKTDSTLKLNQGEKGVGNKGADTTENTTLSTSLLTDSLTPIESTILTIPNVREQPFPQEATLTLHTLAIVHERCSSIVSTLVGDFEVSLGDAFIANVKTIQAKVAHLICTSSPTKTPLACLTLALEGLLRDMNIHDKMAPKRAKFNTDFESQLVRAPVQAGQKATASNNQMQNPLALVHMTIQRHRRLLILSCASILTGCHDEFRLDTLCQLHELADVPHTPIPHTKLMRVLGAKINELNGMVFGTQLGTVDFILQTIAASSRCNAADVFDISTQQNRSSDSLNSLEPTQVAAAFIALKMMIGGKEGATVVGWLSQEDSMAGLIVQRYTDKLKLLDYASRNSARAKVLATGSSAMVETAVSDHGLFQSRLASSLIHVARDMGDLLETPVTRLSTQPGAPTVSQLMQLDAEALTNADEAMKAYGKYTGEEVSSVQGELEPNGFPEDLELVAQAQPITLDRIASLESLAETEEASQKAVLGHAMAVYEDVALFFSGVTSAIDTKLRAAMQMPNSTPTPTSGPTKSKENDKEGTANKDQAAKRLSAFKEVQQMMVHNQQKLKKELGRMGSYVIRKAYGHGRLGEEILVVDYSSTDTNECVCRVAERVSGVVNDDGALSSPYVKGEVARCYLASLATSRPDSLLQYPDSAPSSEALAHHPCGPLALLGKLFGASERLVGPKHQVGPLAAFRKSTTTHSRLMTLQLADLVLGAERLRMAAWQCAWGAAGGCYDHNSITQLKDTMKTISSLSSKVVATLDAVIKGRKYSGLITTDLEQCRKNVMAAPQLHEYQTQMVSPLCSVSPTSAVISSIPKAVSLLDAIEPALATINRLCGGIMALEEEKVSPLRASLLLPQPMAHTTTTSNIEAQAEFKQCAVGLKKLLKDLGRKVDGTGSVFQTVHDVVVRALTLPLPAPSSPLYTCPTPHKALLSLLSSAYSRASRLLLGLGMQGMASLSIVLLSASQVLDMQEQLSSALEEAEGASGAKEEKQGKTEEANMGLGADTDGATPQEGEKPPPPALDEDELIGENEEAPPKDKDEDKEDGDKSESDQRIEMERDFEGDDNSLSDKDSESQTSQQEQEGDEGEEPSLSFSSLSDAELVDEERWDEDGESDKEPSIPSNSHTDNDENMAVDNEASQEVEQEERSSQEDTSNPEQQHEGEKEDEGEVSEAPDASDAPVSTGEEEAEGEEESEREVDDSLVRNNNKEEMDILHPELDSEPEPKEGEEEEEEKNEKKEEEQEGKEGVVKSDVEEEEAEDKEEREGIEGSEKAEEMEEPDADVELSHDAEQGGAEEEQQEMPEQQDAANSATVKQNTKQAARTASKRTDGEEEEEEDEATGAEASGGPDDEGGSDATSTDASEDATKEVLRDARDQDTSSDMPSNPEEMQRHNKRGESSSDDDDDEYSTDTSSNTHSALERPHSTSSSMSSTTSSQDDDDGDEDKTSSEDSTTHKGQQQKDPHREKNEERDTLLAPQEDGEGDSDTAADTVTFRALTQSVLEAYQTLVSLYPDAVRAAASDPAAPEDQQHTVEAGALELDGFYRSGCSLSIRRCVEYVASGFAASASRIYWRRRPTRSQRRKAIIALDDSISMRTQNDLLLAAGGLEPVSPSHQASGITTVAEFAVVATAVALLVLGAPLPDTPADTQLVAQWRTGPAGSWPGGLGSRVRLFRFAEEPAELPPALSTLLSGSLDKRHMEAMGDTERSATVAFDGESSNLCLLLQRLINEAEVASSPAGGDATLLFVVSDGLVGDRPACAQMVRRLAELNVFCVLLLIDVPAPGGRCRLSTLTSATVVGGKVEMKPYLEDCPFEKYVVVRDAGRLPEVMGSLLVQWATGM